MAVDGKRLESLRSLFRTLMMVCIALELAGFGLVVAGKPQLGLIVGILAMAGHMASSRIGKRRFGDACAQVQAENTLGLDGNVYEGRVAFDGSELHASGMISSALKIDSTLKQHALRGSLDGVEMRLGEITFGVVYPGQNKHEFNSGVLVSAPLARALETSVLLMGHHSVRHKLIRKEYEDDGWKLCPVGGKNKGWFVFTRDGSIPGDELLDKLDALSRAAEGAVLLSMKDGMLHAFFLGSFYTGTYPLGEAVEEKELRKQLFPHLPALAELVK